MKKLIISALMLCSAGIMMAQNSALYKSQMYLDRGDIKEAVNVLEAAVTNPKTTKLAEVQNKLGELYAQIMNPELVKAANGMPFDTVLFATYMDKSLLAYQASHEADVTPDSKGRVKPKFVDANRSRVLSMLDYYNFAGVFMSQMKQPEKSKEYFEKYLALAESKIFTLEQKDSILAAKKEAYVQTAANLAILNYQAKNHAEALRYAQRAIKQGEPSRDLYIISMQSHLAQGDSAAWLACLKEAVGTLGDVSFMQNLVYHYVTKGDIEAATQMAADLTAGAPESYASWYIKGCVELNMKSDYAAARESFARCLALNPDFPEANINMAYSYMNEVVANKLNGKYKYIGASTTVTGKVAIEAYKKELAEVQQYYKDALPYMEKARQLKPEEPKSWAYALQMIYDNLQMKEQKEEIDQIISTL